MDENKLIITPKTKVLQLIEAYPQLEEVLIGYVPAFEKLKNPVLRKTVARVATLQQAAAIGNVKVEELINVLRKTVGQDLLEGTDEMEFTTRKPQWFDSNKVASEIDVRVMLQTGEQPVNQIMADLTDLSSDKIYKVVAPFITAPLIDKASSLGIKHWVEKIDDEHFNIYFYKP
ncbi:MAG: DUF1858 domain-containing protein [Bacteroidales bacterium]|nr:DUF1858 domain-containing protein [Bacteroidales bacterium]